MIRVLAGVLAATGGAGAGLGYAATRNVLVLLTVPAGIVLVGVAIGLAVGLGTGLATGLAEGIRHAIIERLVQARLKP